MPVSYASTIGQYALLGAVVGGATIYYRPHVVQELIGKISPSAQPTPVSTQNESGKKKGKKATKDPQTTGSETAKSKAKKRKITGPIDENVTVTRTDGQKKELPRDTDDDINNADFARSLAKAQTGTKLQSSSKQNVPATSRLSSTIQPLETHDAREQHVKSDADDEDSSVEGLNKQEMEASGRDVSDMLEKPPAGPAVLRLTNVSEPKKKQQAPKKFEEVQTKKQRQRQARKEEQKRMVQESDRVHEQKKQEHLRQARMAAGTSNQIKADKFAATAQNAWQTKSQPSATSSNAQPTALLDTFDNNDASKESVTTQQVSSKPSRNNAAELKSSLGDGAARAVTASGRENGLVSEQLSLSEEEQMERVRAQEQETAWESVQSKKSKKKNRRDDTSSEASFSVSDAQPAAPRSQVVQPSQQPVQNRQNGVKSASGSKPQDDSNNRFATITVDGLANDEWAA